MNSPFLRFYLRLKFEFLLEKKHAITDPAPPNKSRRPSEVRSEPEPDLDLLQRNIMFLLKKNKKNMNPKPSGLMNYFLSSQHSAVRLYD